MRFLSASESLEFIASDSDRYLRSMSQIDLAARNSVSLLDYLSKIAATDFSRQEKRAISRSARDVDRRLSQLRGETFARLSAIPWRFAKTCDDFEGGMPHTRGDTVFLPESVVSKMLADRRLARRVLIHEKTHLLQRKHPQLAREFISRRYNATPLRPNTSPLRRANPDSDGFDYLDRQTQKIMSELYSARSATEIYSQGDDPRCHPYETMAYEMESVATTIS
jgi:hypothetical protein